MTENTPPPPPPLGGSRPGWRHEAPVGPAKAIIWLALANTAVTFLVALTASGFVKDLETKELSELAASPHQLLSQLSLPLMIGVWIAFALWMTKVRETLESEGVPQRLPKVFAWVGWIIPIASIVLPYMYMRDLNKKAGSSALLPWWLLYLASGLAAGYSGVALFSAMDLSTGEVDASEINGYATGYLVSAVLLLASWAFLRKAITDITNRTYADA